MATTYHGYSIREEKLQALVKAIEASGEADWPASRVSEFLTVHPKNLSTRLARALEQGALHRRQEGRNFFYALGPDPAGFVGDFEPALYGDGMLALFNCPTDEKGTPTLTRAQASRVKALLNGSLIP
jgi:hypothetical protein